jgi:hypothetical protein
MGAREAWVEAAAQLGLAVEKQSRIRKDPLVLGGDVGGVPLRVWWSSGATEDFAEDQTFIEAGLIGGAPVPSGLHIAWEGTRKTQRLLRKEKAVEAIERDGGALCVRAKDAAAATLWLTPPRRDALQTAFAGTRWLIDVDEKRLRARRIDRRISDPDELVAAVRESVRVVRALR